MSHAYLSLRTKALESIQRLEINIDDRDLVLDLARNLVEDYQRNATSGGSGLPLHDTGSMVERLASSLLEYGPLTPFLDGSLDYEELIIHGDQVSYINTSGRLVAYPEPISEDEVVHVVAKLLATVGGSVDESRPITQTQVLDGRARLGVVLPPIADRIDVTLRRYLTKRQTFDELIEWGALNSAAASLLTACMRTPTGVLVTGQPGSGKTTVLNAMLRAAPPSLRTVACEDTPELSVEHLHAARWRTRPAGVDGQGEVSLRDLVRAALGMRPDLIALGEIRGSESLELTRAGNAGCGMLSTIHANSARYGLQALVSTAAMAGGAIPVNQLRNVFSSIIDLVVHVAKEPTSASLDASGGRRQVMEIVAVPALQAADVDFSVEPLFVRERFGAPLRWTGSRLPPDLESRLDQVLAPLGFTSLSLLEGSRAA